MKKTIFKEYDIRGKYKKEIGKEEIKNITRAFVSFLKIKEGKKIVVGRDKNKNSKEISDFIKEELISLGVEVINIEEATTPLFNFAVAKEKAEGGMMVTASHLGDKYAGIKLEGGEGTIKPEEILKFLEEKRERAGREGKAIKKFFLENYAEYQGKKIKLKNKIKAVVDSSSGMGGRILELALKAKTKSLKKICFNGCRHEDNILEKKNQKDIEEYLKKGGFDLGVLFDGDGDRVLFFDEKGSLVAPEIILAILADYYKPKCFVGNETVTEEVREIFEKNGGKCEEAKTGHSFIKEKMREKKAFLGGEHSGHIYFSDRINGKDFYSEMPILAVLSIFKVLEEKGKKMSQVAEEFNKFWRSGEKNIKMKEKNNFEKVKEEIKKKYKEEKIRENDGVTVQGKDFWINLRMSNTEDLLRINLKAKKKEIGREKMREVLKLIK